MSTRWIGTEEQRGVLLVDQHRQAEVERAAGLAGLHAEVGRVPVVAVGDQRLAAGQGVGQRAEHLGVADRPDPVALVVAVDEVVGRVRGGNPSYERPHLRRSAVHEQDRRRVEGELGHPVGQRVRLGRVDALVGEHGPVLGAGGAVGDVEGADQPPDRHARPRCTRAATAPGPASRRSWPRSCHWLRRAATARYGRAKSRRAAGSPTRRGFSRSAWNGSSRRGRPTYGGVTTARESISRV